MQTFEAMNAAIAANKIKPVIDRVIRLFAGLVTAP
jgi:hypothetical protein